MTATAPPAAMPFRSRDHAAPAQAHGLSEEHEQLRRTVESFAQEVVAQGVAERYDAGDFPYAIVRGMGEMGLFGLPFPESDGGMGGDYLALCLAIEELARVDSSVAITLEAAVGLGAMPLHRFASAELRERWLPALCRGEALGAFGLTEPGGGTDAGATRTTARLADGRWTIDGEKAFITNSGTHLTAFVIVTAVTGERADGSPEISAILVPTGTEGMTIGPPYSKVGWTSSDTHPVSLAGCVVPEDHLVGERGRGYAQFLSILDEGRIAIAALATGLAQGCVDASVEYASTREAFGRPIAGHQAVAFTIADLETRAHLARTAWRDAAARMAAGEPFARQAAVAKLYASGAAVDNARDAVQVHGGFGYTNEAAVARHWRDAKILEIGEGTNEVQRMVIARDLGLPLD